MKHNIPTRKEPWCKLFTRGNSTKVLEEFATALLATALLLLREPYACLKSTKKCCPYSLFTSSPLSEHVTSEFLAVSRRGGLPVGFIVTSRRMFHITAVQPEDGCMVISLTFIQYTPSLISTPIRDEQPRV
jgi:hypothetical protein